MPDLRRGRHQIVGIPAFITGHNGHAAWGSTSAQVDNADLFLEELSDDGRRVRQGDGWQVCHEVVERIPVKGATSVDLRVIRTPRGAIVARAGDSDASIFEPVPMLGRANALSFAATWLDRRPTRALLAFHHAKSFQQFREACAKSAGCSYSLIYADREAVGWVLAAEVAAATLRLGSLPLAGWLPNVGWSGVTPSNELPYSENQTRACVLRQQQPWQTARAPCSWVMTSWTASQRRISEELAAKTDWTVERMAALQTDVQSLAFADVRTILLALPRHDAEAARALELLETWDGRLAGDSIAASVYELFLGALNRKICETKAPNSYLYASGKGVMKLIPGTCLNSRRASFLTRMIREQPSGYFEGWQAVLTGALAEAIKTLTEKFGPAPEAWAWGKIRQITLRTVLAIKAAHRVFIWGPCRAMATARPSTTPARFWDRSVPPTSRLIFVRDRPRNWAPRVSCCSAANRAIRSRALRRLGAVYRAVKACPSIGKPASAPRPSTLTLVPSMSERPAAPKRSDSRGAGGPRRSYYVRRQFPHDSRPPSRELGAASCSTSARPPREPYECSAHRHAFKASESHDLGTTIVSRIETRKPLRFDFRAVEAMRRCDRLPWLQRRDESVAHQQRDGDPERERLRASHSTRTPGTCTRAPASLRYERPGGGFHAVR